MTINSILFTQAYREPALLNVGTKENSYESLATYLASDTSLTSASTTSAYATDTVDISLKQVASKLITELAGLTAETIKEYPEFQNDYVLAIVDDGQGGREARVYSREELIEAAGGTDEEKEQMRQALAAQPLLVYSSADQLPETSQSEAAADLAKKANAFLTTNGKLLNILDTYGYNPFESLKLS